MPSVLRAGSVLAIVAALAAAPSSAQSPAPELPSSVTELASCADGRGGRWIAEKAGWNDSSDVRVVNVSGDGARSAPVAVRRTGGAQGVAVQLRCDGRGGAWLAWTEIDYLTITTEVRAAHVGEGGALLARGDEALASFFDLFDAVSLLADGRGGAYVAWREADAKHDRHVRLSRLAADGRAASGWPASGLTLDEPRGNVRPRLVTDGEGGAIVMTDPDPNHSGSVAYALRVSPTAALLR